MNYKPGFYKGKSIQWDKTYYMLKLAGAKILSHRNSFDRDGNRLTNFTVKLNEPTYFRSLPLESIGGFFDFIESDTLEPGFYGATVENKDYLVLKNPLDIALKLGQVELISAENFGFGADKIWIKIKVPNKVKSKEIKTLNGWADWEPVSNNDTARDVLPSNVLVPETPVLDITESLAKRVENLGDIAKVGAAISAKVVGAALGLGLVFWFIGRKK
jgi:hypothetical protein